MKKLIALLALMFVGMNLHAQSIIDSVVNDGSVGTTSATVIVKPGTSSANITDMSTRVDANNVSATVDIRQGRTSNLVTSATSGSGTVLWFDNNPTIVNSGDFVIFHDASAGTFTLLKANGSASASITTQETISVALATTDIVYTLETRIRRPARDAASSTVPAINIWLPANVPSALTLDGNTTSCQISISGVRANSR